MASSGDRLVRWGILSSAKIARTALIPAISAAANAELVFLGTPRPERVAENQALYGYAILPSYQDVLNSDVDAIYNPLPNGMHAEWSIRALESGKHVLCEKPLTVLPEETRRMIEVSQRTDRLLMEAFMYRFHPQISLARELVDSGRIGTLRLIRASFSFNAAPNPENPRFQTDQGPGALLDVGCYCINATRYFSGGLPVAVSAWSTRDPGSGGDLSTHAVLEYSGHAALIDCSFESFGRSGLELVGSSGKLEILKPWLPGGEPASLRLTTSNGVEEILAPAANHYQLMVEHFSQCILDGTPVRWGPEDALENMRVLEATRRSAAEQRRVPLSEV